MNPFFNRKSQKAPLSSPTVGTWLWMGAAPDVIAAVFPLQDLSLHPSLSSRAGRL